MSYGWIVQLVQGGVAAGQASDQYKHSFKQQAKAAEEAAAHDKSVMTSAMNTIGRLNVERAGMYREVSSALYQLQSAKALHKSATANTSAAAGVTGASVQAVLADADRQASEATANIRYNQQVQDARLSNMKMDILNKTEERFVSHKLQEVMSRRETAFSIFGAFLAGFGGTNWSMPSQGTGSQPSTAGSSFVGNSGSSNNDGFVSDDYGYYSTESGTYYQYSGDYAGKGA